MKPGEHIVLRAAAKLYLPLIALFGAALLATREAGAGIGLIAAFAFALAMALHVIVFGARAARTAFPGWVARLCVALGVLAALSGLPSWRFAAQALEVGLFLTALGALSLIIAALVGRVPSLKDESW